MDNKNEPTRINTTKLNNQTLLPVEICGDRQNTCCNVKFITRSLLQHQTLAYLYIFLQSSSNMILKCSLNCTWRLNIIRAWKRSYFLNIALVQESSYMITICAYCKFTGLSFFELHFIKILLFLWSTTKSHGHCSLQHR